MSFQQGLSGLNSTSKNLEVIGNNIANANTYGNKSSRAEFADMYANAMGGGASGSVGIGTRLETVAQQFTQGNITSTDNPLDLAISGGGFFQLKDTTGATLYGRNGQFKVDEKGFIVNNQQQKLLGYMADAKGQIVQSAPTEIQLSTKGIPPKATDGATMELNLDSRGGVTLPATGAMIKFDDPKTFNNATSQNVYDVQGKPVTLTYYFQKTPPTTDPVSGNQMDNWNVYLAANGKAIDVDVDGNPIPHDTLTFDPSDPSKPVDPLMSIAVPQTLSATGEKLTEAIGPFEMNMGGATQYGAAFSVTDLTQTGNAFGQITGLSVGDDGKISVRYSNGQTKDAGQVELATFRNPQGLQPVGGNAWAATNESGGAVRGVPSTGNFGSLQAGALEESNVDLTAELVNMITAQRSYQANAQTIKTQDQVLQTLVNLR
jgi:flagellar hook protein FlgE